SLTVTPTCVRTGRRDPGHRIVTRCVCGISQEQLRIVDLCFFYSTLAARWTLLMLRQGIMAFEPQDMIKVGNGQAVRGRSAIEHAPIEVCQGVFRIEAQSLAEIGKSLVGHTLLGVCKAAVVIHESVI